MRLIYFMITFQLIKSNRFANFPTNVHLWAGATYPRPINAQIKRASANWIEFRLWMLIDVNQTLG